MTTVAATYECTLLGILPSQRLASTIEVLRGLCPIEEKNFSIWEVFYRLEAAGSQPNDLVARCWLSPERANTWMLRYLGRAAQQDKLTIGVRSIIDIPINNDNLIQFLSVLGCKQQEEYVRRGILFRTRKNISITVSRVHMVPQRNQPESALVTHEESYVVHASTIVQKDGLSDATDDLNALASYLKPDVELSKANTEKPIIGVSILK
mmetsp:Transcript_24494/g.40289  ORF Transcript_24494/g.40289 Transcript_24494/m.40289 type:complete len:208 (-) Transcript_24494:965-1588(-)